MLVVLKTLLFMVALQGVAIGAFRWALTPPLRRIVGPTEVAILLLIPVAGLFGPNLYVFYAFLFAAALTALGSADRLLVRYLLLLVCFPGLPTVIMIGGAYISEASAGEFFALGALIVLIGLGRRTAPVAPALMLSAWAIFGTSLLLTVRGLPLNGVLREIPAAFMGTLVPFFIVAKAIRNRPSADRAALAMIWGGMCNATVAIFESVRHWLLYQSLYQHLHAAEALGVSATLSMRAGMLRAHGIVFEYECLGLLTAFALVTATAYRSRFSAAGFLVIALTLAGGCLASQARGGWIAAIVGLTVLAVYEHRWRLLAGLVAVGGPLLLALRALGSNHERLAQFIGSSGHGQQTLDYRSTLFSRGVEEVLAHPLTGQTRDQLQVSMNDLRQGQQIIDFVNVHLNVALIGGFPLLAIWFLALAAPLYLGWRARSRGSGESSPVPMGLPLALVAAAAIFVAGTSFTDRILPLLMIALGLTSSFLRLNAGAGATASRPARPRVPLVQPLPV